MTPAPDDWSPDPELLAAYYDDELTGRPDLEALHGRITDWLRDHPEACEVLADYRRLTQLWQDSTPPSPRGGIWDDLESDLAQAMAPPAPRRRGSTVALVATAAVIALLVGLGIAYRLTPQGPVAQPRPPAVPAVAVGPDESTEILPVATAAEVVILRVEGADTQTLAVGVLLVYGLLELAGPGDVALTSVQPDARDRMMPQVRMDGPGRPLIWAPAEPVAP